jgi:hypothetical protein
MLFNFRAASCQLTKGPAALCYLRVASPKIDPMIALRAE